MSHDLSQTNRNLIERRTRDLVATLSASRESLGISREAMINAFDEAAHRLDEAR